MLVYLGTQFSSFISVALSNLFQGVLSNDGMSIW